MNMRDVLSEAAEIAASMMRACQQSGDVTGAALLASSLAKLAETYLSFADPGGSSPAS